MFGKTSESLRGSTRVLPPSTLLRVSMMASSTMALPAVRAVMSRLSRIGTPEEVSVASVRQKRATAILRRMMPRIGRLQHRPVDDAAAAVGLVVAAEEEDARGDADDDEDEVAGE